LGARLRQAPGNHENLTAGAAGYFVFFGSAAAGGRYSFDVGDWHFISLDSNCAEAGGCSAGSAEGRWLQSDLAAHPGRCTLAYWHHPRFSSGLHGSDPTYRVFWRILGDGGADVVLAGHDHDYERFALQNADGAADPVAGLREFVVGTGGKDLRAFGALAANSVVRRSDQFGVLRLRLRAGSYDWEFLNPSGVVLDAGSSPCRGPESDPALHLAGGRFRVDVTWRDGHGGEGIARPAPEASPAAGVMWFFEPANWELLVKVIDGCSLNGHRWLFVTAATNVGFTLHAVDTVSGQAYDFTNRPGSAPAPLQDTRAFPCS
jgi:hypothetical protein